MGVTCPDCGHQRITADFTCHTYGGVESDGKERWWSCQGCDSAIEYSCGCWLDDEDDEGHYRQPECECMWSYTHYLNPRNPRFAKEEEGRPDWLPELTADDLLDGPVKHSKVLWWWET